MTTYYEIHSKKGHVKLTDDKIDVREALIKNLIVVEVHETAMYLKEVVVRTTASRQIETIETRSGSFFGYALVQPPRPRRVSRCRAKTIGLRNFQPASV